jgi:hypothetical protein
MIIFMRLPLPHRITYAILIFNDQVLNGGLHQYFSNHYGIFCYETVEYLKRIKANSSAEVLRKAILEVNSDNDSREVFRDKILNQQLLRLVGSEETLATNLDRLDDEYYTSGENVGGLLAKYLLNL